MVYISNISTNTYPQTSWKSLIDKPVCREEKCHKHTKNEKSHLFSSYDMDGTEIEVLDFLYSLVRMTKPMHILETGTWKAYGTIALACALKDNGHGKLTSIEIDKTLAENAVMKLKKHKLLDFVEVVCAPTLEYFNKLNEKIDKKYDFSFFDSTRPDRPNEFELLIRKKLISGIVCFHDTSRLRIENHKGKNGIQKNYVSELDKLQKKIF